MCTIRPSRRFIALVLAAGASGLGLTLAALATAAQSARAVTCVAGDTDLTNSFAQSPDGLQGADYQRAIDLPDGRRLWTFQDAYVERPGRSDSLVHNVAVVQRGACFELLHGGTADRPTSWLAADVTTPFKHWFWPLGATVPDDGTVRLFVAELEERGSHYLANATPIATWVATIEMATLEPVGLQPAPDPGPALYGWSVATDARFAYLYGHCYRQFGFGFLGHDACTSAVTVARTSHDLKRAIEYWNGTSWVADPAAAINIVPTAAPDGTPRAINPTQFAHFDGRWIAVTKEGDWWGSTIYVDIAARPTGPWTTAAMVDATAHDNQENTYFASIIAADGDGKGVLIGLSHNRWDGARTRHYRPTFQTIPLPPSPGLASSRRGTDPRGSHGLRAPTLAWYR